MKGVPGFTRVGRESGFVVVVLLGVEGGILGIGQGYLSRAVPFPVGSGLRRTERAHR